MWTSAFLVKQGTAAATRVAGTGMAEVAPEGEGNIGGIEKVAYIIKKSIRSRDLASRYGGEEFTIMLNKTTSENAVKVAERIRRNIEQYDFTYNNKHLRITLSGGVTTFSAEKNPAKSANILVDQADRALYFSKEHGRNCITFADEEMLASIEHHREGS